MLYKKGLDFSEDVWTSELEVIMETAGALN